MKIDILPIKIKFEKEEEKYSKLYKSYHYMNYGYCEIDGEIYFYYWDYKDDYLNEYYVIIGENEKFIIDNLLTVKIYTRGFKHVNKFKYILDLIFKRKNRFRYFS